MVNIVTRTLGDTAKNSPLTNEEVDQNFLNLKDSVVAVQEALNGSRGAQFNLLEWMLGLQCKKPGAAFGAIRWHDSPAEYRDGEIYYKVEPYFASMSVYYALGVEPLASKAYALNWLNFWMNNMSESTGTCGVHFVKHDETAITVKMETEHAGVPVEDATDSNIALFVLALTRYIGLFGTEGLKEGWEAQVQELVTVKLEALKHEKGLYIAKKTYPMMYLMDNIEVWAALTAIKPVVPEVDPDTLMDKIREHLWNVEGYWHPSYDGQDKGVVDLNQLYPSFAAQLWPVLFGAEIVFPYEKFKQIANEWYKANSLGSKQTDAAIALAAAMCGHLQEAAAYVTRIQQLKWNPEARSFAWPFTVADAATMLVTSKLVSSQEGVLLRGAHDRMKRVFDFQNAAYKQFDTRLQEGLGAVQHMSNLWYSEEFLKCQVTNPAYTKLYGFFLDRDVSHGSGNFALIESLFSMSVMLKIHPERFLAPAVLMVKALKRLGLRNEYSVRSLDDSDVSVRVITNDIDTYLIGVMEFTQTLRFLLGSRDHTVIHICEDLAKSAGYQLAQRRYDSLKVIGSSQASSLWVNLTAYRLFLEIGRHFGQDGNFLTIANELKAAIPTHFKKTDGTWGVGRRYTTIDDMHIAEGTFALLLELGFEADYTKLSKWLEKEDFSYWNTTASQLSGWMSAYKRGFKLGHRAVAQYLKNSTGYNGLGILAISAFLGKFAEIPYSDEILRGVSLTNKQLEGLREMEGKFFLGFTPNLLTTQDLLGNAYPDGQQSGSVVDGYVVPSANRSFQFRGSITLTAPPEKKYVTLSILTDAHVTITRVVFSDLQGIFSFHKKKELPSGKAVHISAPVQLYGNRTTSSFTIQGTATTPFVLYGAWLEYGEVSTAPSEAMVLGMRLAEIEARLKNQSGPSVKGISEYGAVKVTATSSLPMTITFEKSYAKPPTVVATLYDAAQTRLLYGMSVTNTQAVFRSNYFSTTQFLHYIVISND